MLKRLFVLCLILFIVFTIWVGMDRHKMQQRILELERQADGIFFPADLADWRKKHPLDDMGPRTLELQREAAHGQKEK